MRKEILGTLVATTLLAFAPAAHAGMSWSPASHDFGTQEAGVSSAPVTFTLTASCDAGAGPCTVPAGGVHNHGVVDAPGDDFNVDANGCTSGILITPTFPSTTSCTVKVAFKPAATGPRTGQLQTASGLVAPLSGNGVDQDQLRLEALLKKCKKKKYRKKHRKKCRKARRRS
jgi:hypothetical protein